jgi:hypothetical protein
MKLRKKITAIFLRQCLFLFSILFALAAWDNAVAQKAADVTADNVAAEYIARTVSVSDSDRVAFLQCMRRNDLRVRKRLKRDGVLSEQSVFETTSTIPDTLGAPFWNFLILTRVGSSEGFFRAEEMLYKKGRRTNCFDAPEIKTRRVEVLRTTPKSFYPRPRTGGGSRSAEFSVRYIVEYIAVQNTPAALDEYRETMRMRLGPALGRLIAEDQLLNFIALETVSVKYSQAGMPEWNQIHVRGTNFPEKGAVRPAMDRVLKSMDPNSGGASAVYGRLDAIRTKPREDVARPVEELAIR